MEFSLFGKIKDKIEKKKDKEIEKVEDNKALEQEIVDNIANKINPEKAVITYILLQSQKNSISLAKKEDVTYISFKNNKISDFLNEWYTLLKLHQSKNLSDKMYKVFIDSQLEENKVTDEEKFLTDDL